MQLAQGQYWRASLAKDSGAVALEVLKGVLPDDLAELRELRIEVPVAKWGLVVKYVQSDRKLLGGVLLDFGRPKKRVSTAIGSDRLFLELRRIALDATVALIEREVLALVPTAAPTD